MKLYLLKFTNFLRVVIGSANLFESDWNNWNNIIWIKDFPQNPKNKQFQETSFSDYLISLL